MYINPAESLQIGFLSLICVYLTLMCYLLPMLFTVSIVILNSFVCWELNYYLSFIELTSSDLFLPYKTFLFIFFVIYFIFGNFYSTLL